MKYEFVAPCYFGTESSAAFDFKRLGAENITVTDGRVAFTGDEQVLASANIESRCAERILMLLKRVKVTTFDELFDNVFSIPWEQLLPQDAEFPVKGASLSSPLSSVPACQSIVKKAMVERLKKGHKTAVLPEDGELYKVRFSIRKDLLEGFSTLPIWMQSLVRELPGCDPKTAAATVLKRPQTRGSAKRPHSKSAIGEAS